LEVSGGSQRTS
jgi:hypothetical protein